MIAALPMELRAQVQVREQVRERAVLLFKRAVLLLILSPFLVPTSDMLADIFTKATERGTFTRLRNAMMNVHGPLRHRLQPRQPLR